MKDHDIDKITLAAYLAGDLEAEEAKRLKEHLPTCTECESYLMSLKREQKAFLEKFPFVSSTYETAPKKIIQFPVYYRYLALAALFLLMVTGPLIYFNTYRQSEYHLKGKTGTRILVKNLAGTIEERDVHQYYPQEQIQFLYSCSERTYFMLLSIDEKGNITTYFPQQGDSSSVLSPGVDLPLNNSIMLDDYIGEELFMAFFADHQFSAMSMRNWMTRVFTKSKSLSAVQRMTRKGVEIHPFLITKLELKQ